MQQIKSIQNNSSIRNSSETSKYTLKWLNKTLQANVVAILPA